MNTRRGFFGSVLGLIAAAALPRPAEKPLDGGELSAAAWGEKPTTIVWYQGKPWYWSREKPHRRAYIDPR